MDLGWPHRRCIFCLRPPSESVPFSRAHLVPVSIGGFVWAWTKCKECNEQTGAEIEADVVRDDSIAFAVEALADRLPELSAKFAKRATYVTKTPHGIVRARRRGDDFEILTTSSDEGSLMSSRENARAALEKRLSRLDRPQEEIESALALFDQAAIGIPVEIDGSTFTHGTVDEFGPAFDGVPVSEGFPSLIAFHFLALALGPNVYDDQLNGLRDAIRRGEPHSDWHVAERFIERVYKPEHIVGLAQTHPHVVVRVQLFGWNVWRVHFPRIVSASEPHGIALDLVSRQMHFAAPRPLAQPIASLPEPASV